MRVLRASTLVFTLLLSAVLLLVLTPNVEAKTLVGSPCSKIGLQRGDGAGKTVICRLVGKKKLWQVLKKVASTPSSPDKTNNSSPSPRPSPINSAQTTPTGGNSCSKRPQFTANFIDPKFVRTVTPIGEQTGSGGVIAVRSYIHPSREFLDQELPIYAPADMTLFQASYYKPPGSSSTYQPEYSLYFSAGCGILVKFFHIKGVVGKVLAAVPTQPSPSSAGQNVLATDVKAGEQIGWYKLGDSSVAFDFWVDDTEITNQFIEQSHFSDSNALHSVCPYDLYTADLRKIWLDKLGAPGSDPIPGTTCGAITQGVSGTADGMWFISENTLNDHLTYDGAYQSQISFTTDPSGMVRIGGLNAVGAPAQMMISSNDATWKKPVDIKIGSSHCWSNSQQSVKVEVLSDRKMAVNVGSGSCDAVASASSGRIYYR